MAPTLQDLIFCLQLDDIADRLYARQMLVDVDTKVLANNISSIISLLEEEDALSKRCALGLLQRLSPINLLTALLGRLVPLLEDDDADVRRGVVVVLQRVPSEALDDYAELILSFASHEKWPVRVTGLGAFQCLSTALTETHLDDMLTISLADADSTSVRWTALDLLQRHVEECFGGGISRENGKEEALAARRIRDQEGESLHEILLAQTSKVVDMFADFDKTIRWKAASVFASYPVKELAESIDAINSVMDSLEHSLANARATTLLAMAQLGRGRKADKKMVREEEEEEEGVIGSLLLLFRPRVVHEVTKRVRDEDAAVRWAALQAIQRMPVEALLAADTEEGQDFGRGWLVAEVLSQARGEGGVGNGDRRTELDNMYVQQAAMQLLERLHKASGGALVGEEVTEEVCQIQQRLEAEEAAACPQEWDEKGGKWRHD